MSKRNEDDKFNTNVFLTKLRSRDASAFAEVVHAYTGPLLYTALSLGFKKTEAEDLAQTVWLTFFDVIPNFEGRSSVKTFLIGILYNRAHERRRENQRSTTHDTFDLEFDKNFDSSGHWIKTFLNPEEFAQATQIMNEIEFCLEALPQQQKEAFLLKCVEEEETDSICNILEVSATHLGVLLFRSRNKLRECIEKKVRQKGLKKNDL